MKEITNIEELANIKGGNLLDAGCAIWGGIVVATGGGAAANPVGGFATAFCAGYAIARLFG